MAKSDSPLQEIDLSRAYSPPHTASWADDKAINGFDTETSDGSIFLVSYAWEGFGGATKHNNGKELSPETLWDLMTHSQAKSSLNMWYNLDFDANVILRHLLNKEQLAELTVSGHTQTEEYEITYIKTKFLKIKDSNRNVYTHYDAAQFFYTSLENAVGEWLNETKANDGLEAALFGTNEPEELRKVISDSENETWQTISKSSGDSWTIQDAQTYIQDNWKDIVKYARKDAVLVRDLWEKATEVGERLEIPMGQPFSTGYLAESYLNEHMKEKPGIGPREMSIMAWDSYAGGRFEVIKRGKIGEVVGPDINSAYPHNLSQLPDPKTLRWETVENPEISAIENADFGFVKAKVTTDPTRTIQPFAVKDDSQDKLVYPAIENKEITVIKDIFVHAYNNGYITDYEMKNTWLGYDTGGADYPFKFVKSLYQDRQAAKSRGESQRELLLKIILNSMYGKTCQTTPKIEQVKSERTLEDNEKFVGSLSLPKMIREKYENGFVERLESGAWFNPFLAAYITGLTRLELHKQILNYGLEDNTVMLATDCLMLEADAFDKTNFKDDLVKDGLGNWDKEYRGKAFVIGAGVYQINYETCNSYDCEHYDTTNCDIPSHYYKVKTRGFKEMDLSTDLVKASEKANGKINVESLRPKTIGEAIWQNRPISEVGDFQKHDRKIKADMDTKRTWEQTASFDSLLEGTEISKPLELSE